MNPQKWSEGTQRGAVAERRARAASNKDARKGTAGCGCGACPEQ